MKLFSIISAVSGFVFSLFFSATAQVVPVEQMHIYACDMRITRILSFNQNTLVAIGSKHFSGHPEDDYSFIMRSIDAGLSWDFQERLRSTPLINDAFKLDAFTAVAVGDSGFMVRTTDAGLTWNTVNVPTSFNINHVEFTSTSEGYATCDRTKYLKSTDGGVSWTLVSVASTFNRLYDIEWIDVDTGFVCGNGLYRTVNGGSTWTQVNITAVHELREMQWKNAIQGIIGTGASSSSGYYETSNGGINLTYSSNLNFHQLHRFNPLHFVGVIENYLLETTDGGDSWITKFTFPIANSGLSSVCFFDSLNGWVGGEGLIYSTTDGGNTWSASAYSGKYAHTSSLNVFDSLTVYSNSVGNIYCTYDGGISWLSHPWLNAGGSSRIDFCDLANGYAGMPGTEGLYFTSDTGNTWNLVDSSGNYHLYYAVSAFNPRNLLRYDQSYVGWSSDSAQTWTSVLTHSSGLIYKVDSSTGFYFNGTNTLYRSIDGGNSFQPRTIDVDGKFAMADSLHGCMISLSGVTPYYYVKVTHDGLNTFTLTDSISSSVIIKDVIMLNPSTIVFLENTGLWISINAGVSFDRFAFPVKGLHQIIPVNDYQFIARAPGIIIGLNLSSLITKIDETRLNTNPVIKAHPNPGTGRFHIFSPEGLAISELIVLNSLGQEVNRKQFIGLPEADLEISGESGIYFVRILVDEKPQVIRLIKM